MVFEENRGQAPDGVAYAARGRGYRVHLRGASARLYLAGEGHRGMLEMEVAGAARKALTADAGLAGKSHYLIGDTPKQWLRDVPHFAGAWVRGVYEGIDLHYYGQQRNLEYDFVVRPGADPGRIRMRFRGHAGVRMTAQGDLVFDLGGAALRKRRPVAYSEPGHEAVAAEYRLNEDGTVGFVVGKYDRRRRLVIDPVIDFASYLGGTGTDIGNAVAVDGAGNVYVGGKTDSSAFPVEGAYKGTYGSGEDGFVTKFNATGTAVVFSTYLGGSSRDSVNGIAVDSGGNVYVAGETLSTSFPKLSPVTTSCGSDAFVTKLVPAGNALVYSVCVGGTGTDLAHGLALDAAGNAYIAGDTGGGMAVVNAAQPTQKGNVDAFVGKLNAAGTAWVYLTYLGGASLEYGNAIGVDAGGTACVTGETWSTDLTLLAPLQATTSGFEAYAAKFGPAGNLIYSTYLGGQGLDSGNGAGIDGLGNCYITGSTWSTNFPVQNATQATSKGSREAFVTVYNSSGSAYLYSTYLGGGQEDQGRAIAVTAGGVAHVTGQTSSGDFPILNPAQVEMGDTAAVFMSVNGGTTFSRTASPPLGILGLAVHPTQSQTVYAGTSGGVYRTTDGGASWNRIDSGINYTRIESVALQPGDPCLIYAGAYGSSSFNTNGILVRSLNCGGSWGISANAPMGREVNSIAFSSASPPVLYYGWIKGVTISSTQGGVGRATPSGAEYSYPGYGYHVMVADPLDGCGMYAGDGTGTVYKNTSCSVWNWAMVGTALPVTITALAAHPSVTNSLIAGTRLGEIYRKTGAAAVWTKVATLAGSVNSIVFEPGNPAVVYAAGYNTTVYKSTDGGATWLPAGKIAGSVTELAISPAAPGTIYGGTDSNSDAFYARLSASGALLDATPIGGLGADFGLGIALDGSGNAALTGNTYSSTFPVSAGAKYLTNAGTSDGFVVKLKPSPACNNSLNPAGATPGSSGGAASTSVVAAAGCVWTAVSNVDWITVSGGATGNGSGTVDYTVAANSGTAQRIGTLTIAGQTFTVTQTAPLVCSYQLAGTAANATAGGGAGVAVTVTVAAGCAWTAVSSAAWITVTGGATGNGSGSVNYTVQANSTAAQRIGTITIAGQAFTITQASGAANQTPSVGLASPSGGSTATQTFTFAFHDPNGWTDLDVVNILVNNFLDGRVACYLAYSRSINVLYLVNDPGTALLPGLVMNGSGALSNSQCSIQGTGSSAVGSGNTLTLTLQMTFPAAFGGNRIFYGAARDAVNNSGWKALGTWNVPGAQVGQLTAGGVTPAQGTGAQQTFTFTFQDTTGWQNLGVVNILVNDALDGRFGCYLAYSRPGNVLYLVNDAGTALLPGLVLNGTGTLGNSQCSIAGTGATVSGSGTTLTLVLPVTFAPGFVGNRIIYIAARDIAENNSGWQAKGEWLVP